ARDEPANQADLVGRLSNRVLPDLRLQAGLGCDPAPSSLNIQARQLMKSQVRVRHRRRILCVFRRYAPSFGTFQYAYPLMDGVRAFMPPQGVLVVAAYLPQAWEVRLVDENIRPVCRRPTVKISDMPRRNPGSRSLTPPRRR